MAGVPVVFVPGLMCTGRIYQHQVESLADTHPVLLANHWSQPTMGEIAAQILGNAPDQFALVGTSMGGYVAFEIMRQAPERVVKLVLMSTSARPDTPERSEGRRKEVAGARKYGMRAGTRALWPKLVHPARHEDQALMSTFIEMAEGLGVDAFARQIDAIIGRVDSRPTLAAITAPTLVVVGADDALIPPDQGQEIAAAIKGARIAEVSHAGHMCMIERPEAVTALLRDFLD